MRPSIQFFDSLSQKKQNLVAIDPNHLKFYVCGPTVYDRPHLGNARSVVVYDLFYRIFRVFFDKLTYVRNITDVDDKINNSAKEQGISITQLTAKITEFFHQDTDALNVLRPDFEPKATENIDEMIKMIENLIKKGHAYENSGHVLFDVSSFKDYGCLSNRNLEEMIAGARIEVANYKKNPLDFVLWKPADDQDDQSSKFASPWGMGRPGWHIECSAMSSKYLGENFDIHGGGADLQFPHHENEIAQSICANNSHKFANYWIHNGFLTVNGEKMSKSLKNFITVRDLLDQGISGSVIRLLFLTTHYRKPLDFNDKALEDAKKSIAKFYENLSDDLFLNYDEVEQVFKNLDFSNDEDYYLKQAIKFLADDCNVAKVIALLHEVSKISKKDANVKRQLALILSFLGLFDKDLLKKQANPVNQIDQNYIEQQINLRLEAKKNKDYQLADQIRQDLLKKGILLEDVAGGKTNFTFVK